jgi:hypothetical protein
MDNSRSHPQNEADFDGETVLGEPTNMHAEKALYRAAWDEYRGISRRYWSILVAGIPGVLSLGWLLSPRVNTDIADAAVGVLWMVIWIVSGQPYGRFLCPRCGESFFLTDGGLFYNSLSNRCVHCGLPKNTRDSTW